MQRRWAVKKSPGTEFTECYRIKRTIRFILLILSKAETAVAVCLLSGLRSAHPFHPCNLSRRSLGVGGSAVGFHRSQLLGNFAFRFLYRPVKGRTIKTSTRKKIPTETKIFPITRRNQ